MDNRLRTVMLGKGEAKLITALRKFGTQVDRFGHAMFLKRTVIVTDGYSLALMRRGNFLEDIKPGKVEFGPTPSGASATTLWEAGDLPSGIRKGVTDVVHGSMNGKFAVIEIDARLLLSLLQGMMATTQSPKMGFNMVRIGVRVENDDGFWGKPTTSPIVIARTDISENLSPLVALLMPLHSSGDQEKRKTLVEELITQFEEDTEIPKPQEQEKSNESQER